MANIDKLVKDSIYSKPELVFSSIIPPILELKRDCIFVMDTNALLIPYYASSQELHEIELIFKSLIERHRLLIPGQVCNWQLAMHRFR